MDPELLKSGLPGVFAVLGAVVGAVGAAFAAFINQRGARQATERSLDGQRVIARDEARRRRRESQVQPLVDLARGRVGQYLAWWNEGQPKVELQLHRLDLLRDTAYEAVPDPRFSKAVKVFILADVSLTDMLGGHTMWHLGERNSDFGNRIQELRDRVSALQQAADEYILELERQRGR